MFVWVLKHKIQVRSCFSTAELLRSKAGLATKLTSRLLLVQECRIHELDQKFVFDWV
jgi:hypothetical protein